MLANLRITGATLVDSNLNQVTQPVIGQMLRVKMDFTTESLPSGSSYTLAFSVKGVQLKFDNINWGSGLSFGTWYSTNEGWYAESNTSHTIELRVDLNNTVAETDESDNFFSFAVTPVRASLPAKLSWPETGTLGVDRSLTNYVDLDPTSGLREYTGGKSTYDGHRGLDTGGANNSYMDLGIPILAAAPGTVVDAVDGNFDRNRGTIGNIVPGSDANYVAIDHGGGLVIYYLHMRRDTVRVKVGDSVVRGQPIGLEGSSGLSTGTHLHFEVFYKNMPVDTMLDPAAFWESAPPWILSSRSILTGGITNYDLGIHLGENVSNFDHFLPVAGQRVYAWGLYSGVRQGDAIRAIYKRPDGSVYSNLVLNSSQDWSASYWYFFTSLPTLPDLGTWTVDMLAGGQLLKTYAFEVTNTGQPEVRVEELDPTLIVLDERSTPYDFGRPTVGATAPSQTFRVVNHGSAPLSISTLIVPTGFTIVEGLPATLAAGQSDLFTIGMTTSTPGYKAGQIRILTNDLDETETNFSVEGYVVDTQPQLKLGIGLRRSVEGAQVIANVARTGSVAAALTVALTSSDLTEASLPSSVVIPAGATRASFLINTLQDDVFDGKQIVEFTATATGYDQAKNTLDVEDNRGLAASIVPASISENGGTASITLTRSLTDLWQPLTVQLSATVSGALSFPASVTFAANQTSVTFSVSAIDNNLLEGLRLVNVVATSATHGIASSTVGILDEEHLALDIDQTTISENGGQATLTVRRLNTNIDSKLLVHLANSHPSQVSVADTVELPAGVASVTVPVIAIDDSLLDGLQTITIEALADGYVSASRTFQISDYETLTITIDVPSISEQGGRAIGTVRRNNTDITQPIVVNLSSDDTTEAVVPDKLTISAFQQSASFFIDAVDDFLLEAAQTVRITASSADYVAGMATLIVDDAETLSLQVNATSFSERSGSTLATVSRSNINTSLPLVVTVNSSDTSEASVPQQVTIPAGQASVSFSINGVDDDLLDGLQVVNIAVSATGYQGDTRAVNVSDHEELLLTVDTATLSERQGKALARVTRNNSDIGSELRVSFSNSDATEIQLPTEVVLPPGQRFREFEVMAVDDDLLDGTQNVIVTAMATGYLSARADLAVADFETASLALDAVSMSEKNGTIRVTITRNNTDVESPVTFAISGSDPTEVSVPDSVTIPAGQASVSFLAQSIDDGWLDGDQLVTLTASNLAYPSVNVQLTVSDWEELFLIAAPTKILEEGGQVNVRVGRTNIDNSLPLQVAIAVSDTSELNSVATVVIPAGQNMIEFAVDAVDDRLLDGTQSVELIASAVGYISSTRTIQIEDVEALTLSLDITALDERSGRALATLSRSNTDIENPIVVFLSSERVDRIVMPASVTILAGQSSATFEIQAVNDFLLNASSQVAIAAESTGYNAATVQFNVIDDEALTPWRNPQNRLDVDNSGHVVPLDALILINSLNTEGARELPATIPDPFNPVRYYDCSGDGFLSPMDALLVINFLNAPAAGEGESSIVSKVLDGSTINGLAADLALTSMQESWEDTHPRRTAKSTRKIEGSRG